MATAESEDLPSSTSEVGWKRCRETCGNEPCVLTTGAPGETLTDGIAFCRVSSWVPGTRWVSLPFLDHYEPLLQRSRDVEETVNFAQREWGHQNWNYAELRPLSVFDGVGCGLKPSGSYWLHELDITPSSEKLFRRVEGDQSGRAVLAYAKNVNRVLEYELVQAPGIQ